VSQASQAKRFHSIDVCYSFVVVKNVQRVVAKAGGLRRRRRRRVFAQCKQRQKKKHKKQQRVVKSIVLCFVFCVLCVCVSNNAATQRPYKE
jgi:hypothetical protein